MNENELLRKQVDQLRVGVFGLHAKHEAMSRALFKLAQKLGEPFEVQFIPYYDKMFFTVFQEEFETSPEELKALLLPYLEQLRKL